jgi:hypothetical protein
VPKYWLLPSSIAPAPGAPAAIGQGAQRHGHQHGLHARALGAVAQRVAVLDVARLVGDHAQKLVGVAGLQDQAGVDAHDPPARGEGVQGRSR